MLYSIKIKGEYDKKQIERIQREHYENASGIYELYNSLYMNGYCRSYNQDRILYVGYTLAKERIEIRYDEIEG
ncbi:hypothetical protein [Tissierella sp.]|uniref:hypothetical protein n=1 Tax=Tissierella sp. TaxID=41274 RepID=UPI0028AA0437|nr:hypothetical protein [Tissierella sp.]